MREMHKAYAHSLSALRPFLTLKLRFDQLNQLAEPHVQCFCDSPERIDVALSKVATTVDCLQSVKVSV